MPKSKSLILCGCLAVSLLASLVFWRQNQEMRRALESMAPPSSVEVVAPSEAMKEKSESGATPDVSDHEAEPETTSMEIPEIGPEQQRQAAMAGRYEVSPETLRELLEKEMTAIMNFKLSGRVREMLQITPMEAEAVSKVLTGTAENGRRLEGERAKSVDRKESGYAKMIDPFPEAECLQFEADFFAAIHEAIGKERAGILEKMLRNAVEQETGGFGRLARFYTVSPQKTDVGEGGVKWNIVQNIAKKITFTYTESGDTSEMKFEGGNLKFHSLNQAEAQQRYGHLFDFSTPAPEQ